MPSIRRAARPRLRAIPLRLDALDLDRASAQRSGPDPQALTKLTKLALDHGASSGRLGEHGGHRRAANHWPRDPTESVPSGTHLCPDRTDNSISNSLIAPAYSELVATHPPYDKLTTLWRLLVTRPMYPRPPIVEAVIDFRFASEVQAASLIHALESTLREKYAGSVEKDYVATSARRNGHATFLQSSDGLRLLGCGNSMLSVHVLAPYSGWENFRDQAQEAIHLLPDGIRNESLASLSIRYINRFSLPKTAQMPINDYLVVMPPRPDGMPAQLSGFHMFTQTRDPEDGTIALLTMASAPPDAKTGNPVIIYDLTVQRAGNPLCGLGNGEWIPIIEVLHRQHRDIFEASITDRMRELFQ